VTLGYYDTDAAQSIAQAGTQTTFTLDATGRRSTATTTVGSGPDMTSTDVLRHYTDGSDNPGWTSTTSQTSSGPVTTIERYVGGLDGNLAATLHTGGTDNGVVQLTLVNLHGDTPAQITLPSTGDATGIDRWTTSDEYGNPLDATLTGRTATNDQATTGPNATADADGIGYGWLGTKERATDTSGLLLMGARLYNPTTGTFTSTDPVYGGNTTAYAYPQDPVNVNDIDGRMQLDGMSGNGAPPKPKPKKSSSSTWHRLTSAVKSTASHAVKGLGVSAGGCAAYIVGVCGSLSASLHDGISVSTSTSGAHGKKHKDASYGLGFGASATWQNKPSPSTAECADASVANGCWAHGYVQVGVGPSKGIHVGFTRSHTIFSWKKW
jgi:RHS repeat-associated protein